MIAYDLQCGKGHRFEGWFEDAATYEQQCTGGMIACPVCDDTDVARLPSAFAIKSAKSASAHALMPRTPDEAQIMAQAVMHYMENNFDNVGSDFAKEALKIHYGVAEPRNIRGTSTDVEEETLRREGVGFFKFPGAVDKSETPSPSESDN
ncbi:MAG: DUF1178 family protein [Desulfatitalea sp.]|nr:DUF1178 family protein [Desulfatitalea sp.]NNJ99499.1 DUF1178 family protein [Desulfatitalea sp.]